MQDASNSISLVKTILPKSWNTESFSKLQLEFSKPQINPNSLYASKGEKNPSSWSSSTPNYVTNLLNNTTFVTPLLLCFHSPFSDHCQILYLLIINMSCRQCPSSFPFFQELWWVFFLLPKKLKPKDVHGRSSNYTLGRVLGNTLHNIVLWGHLTKWNDLEELTPNIHELRVCAH